MRRMASFMLACALLASSVALAADPKKVIRDVFPVAETGFDPPAMHDLYSAAIVQAIFERLYTYDYLARPAKLVPQLADGMPQITDDGKTYTVKLKRGIYFVARPRVRRQEARAHRRGHRLHVQADRRSQAALAVDVPARGQVRRARRGNRRGEEIGQVRLRQEDSGNGSGGPVHRALPPEGH